MGGERFYGDYLVAPLQDFRSPRTYLPSRWNYSRQGRKYRFPFREYKDKAERSLENTEMNYTHMFDDKIEDNTPILNELNTIVTQEPTLEELNKEEDHLEFTNETTWTFTEEERKRVNNSNKNITLEEPIPTGGSSSSGTTGEVLEVSPTSVKKRVAAIEQAIEKTNTFKIP